MFTQKLDPIIKLSSNTSSQITQALVTRNSGIMFYLAASELIKLSSNTVSHITRLHCRRVIGQTKNNEFAIN